MQKLVNPFSQNWVQRWHTVHGRNRQILVVIPDHVTLGLALGWGDGCRATHDNSQLWVYTWA